MDKINFYIYISIYLYVECVYSINFVCAIKHSDTMVVDKLQIDNDKNDNEID